jgi:hypothetical protein
MTAQEIYDKVKAHLLNQNAKSISEDGCAYLGDNGLKCAVGCLISDEDYLPDMEGPLNLLIEMYGYLPSIKRLARHAEMLAELQRCHDVCDPYEWPSQLARVAKRHGLKL